MDDIGLCLGREVLGPDLFAALAASRAQRTLLICLPDPVQSKLAAALARVPWEIARLQPEGRNLADTNLLVRTVTEVEPDAAEALPLRPGEALRILLVFAAAPGSTPLAARLERHALQHLLLDGIGPHRRLEVDVLTHGVTRTRLREQIERRSGYHLLHWSGHGNVGLLELHGDDGAPDRLSGRELVDLCVEAGGYFPRLVFLGACHSGDVGRVLDWEGFRAEVEGRDALTREAAGERPLEEQVAQQPGYTGTALDLIRAGVPSVVAMRYAVGDDYARDLALGFYRRLLADDPPKTADAALNQARKDAKRKAASQPALGYHPCDHATPVLLGRADALPAPAGRSRQLDFREPRPPLRAAELKLGGHRHFTGRSRELAALGAGWIAHGGAVRPVALIHALGGMGKTALAAEILDLWYGGFDWVFAWQAKPQPLSLDEFLRDLHTRLQEQQGVYECRIKDYPAEAVYRPMEGEFRGERRYDSLRDNLLRALRGEAILLVLDNFETNLKPSPAESSPAGQGTSYVCENPEWDRTLAVLAEELEGSRSRVLVTCRHRSAALEDRALIVALNPLLPAEAALYARQHRNLRGLVLGDTDEQALARRILRAGRGHPLLLDRLARLAGADRGQLDTALSALEQRKDYARLPDLFSAATGGDTETERAYLHDALETSIDLLIRNAGAEARHLLWVLSLADDPVRFSLLEPVSRGQTLEQERLEKSRSLFAIAGQSPANRGERLARSPGEIRSGTKTRPPANQPDPKSLLSALAAAGLATVECEDEDHPAYTCHELVRERIAHWMDRYPEERRGTDAAKVWVLYGERLAEVFGAQLHQDQATALEAGRRALGFFVRAGAYERLDYFASALVTSTRNPHIQQQFLEVLQTALEQAPAGQWRWTCRGYLADALWRANRVEMSLPLYEQAESEARDAGNWNGVAWITAHRAIVLALSGQFGEAREKRMESAEASRRAGLPEINALSNELEALRISIMQGEVTQAYPGVQRRLASIQAWHDRICAGEAVPEAPDREILLRTLASALDIMALAYRSLGLWTWALDRLERSIAIQRAAGRAETEIATARFNRAGVLRNLNRRSDAQQEMEALLELYEDAGDDYRKGKVLSSLAALFADAGDYQEAVAQERRALALMNGFSDTQFRAGCHNALAVYLEFRGGPKVVESPPNQLAALIYRLSAGLYEDLQKSINNYTADFVRARETGGEVFVPRITDLLARPDFDALRRWLETTGVDPTQLQVDIDQALQTAREEAETG